MCRNMKRSITWNTHVFLYPFSLPAPSLSLPSLPLSLLIRLFPSEAVEKVSPYNFFGPDERITLQVGKISNTLFCVFLCPNFYVYAEVKLHRLVSLFTSLIRFTIFHRLISFFSPIFSHCFTLSVCLQRSKDYEDLLKTALSDLSKSHPVETHELLYNFRLEVSEDKERVLRYLRGAGMCLL